jgi:hypothetical protein
VRLRFFFDPGAGACFWSADRETEAHFGDYPVTLEWLGLPPTLVEAGEALIARHDGAIDWIDPGGPSPWSDADWKTFRHDVEAFLAAVRAALPHIGFEDARR